MAIWRRTLLIAQALFLGAVTALQFVDKDSFDLSQDHWYTHIWRLLVNQRLPIAVLLCSAIFLIAAVKDLLIPRGQRRQMRRKIMEVIMEELFFDQQAETRITIFRDAGFLRHLLLYTCTLRTRND